MCVRRKAFKRSGNEAENKNPQMNMYVAQKKHKFIALCLFEI